MLDKLDYEKLIEFLIINQLDLVGGGQQLNRGYKYLIDNEPGEKVLTFSSARLGKTLRVSPNKHNTTKSKLLCVICNKIIFNNNTSLK